MTKIYQTLGIVDVPQGGTIRDSVGWQADVPVHGVDTHTFYLISFYGIGTTIEDILSNIIAYNLITINTMSMSRLDNIDTPIDAVAPIGTYSCATVIAEDFDGATITGIYDFKVDIDALMIIVGLGAAILDTGFTSV